MQFAHKILILSIFVLGISAMVYWLVYSDKRYQDFVFETVERQTFRYADTLDLDFYAAPNDRKKAKPLIMIVHGGGFAGGQRNGGEEVKMSTYLARKGYAVASIDYRLTRKGASFGCDCPAFAKLNTFVSATEDVYRALAYLVERAEELHIDREKIILMGSSAGAETVLNSAILPRHPLFRTIPYPDVKIIGVVSFSGAVIDASYLTADNAVPMLFFHGEQDSKVPYGNGTHHFCATNAPGYLELDGPLEITAKLAELDVSYTVYVDGKGGHEWADLSYQYPTAISNFLYRFVLGNGKVQEVLEISKTVKEK